MKKIKKWILFASILMLPLLAGCNEEKLPKQIEIVEQGGGFTIFRDTTTKCKYVVVEVYGDITSQTLLKPDGKPLCE